MSSIPSHKEPSKNDVSHGAAGGVGKRWRPNIGERGLEPEVEDHFELVVKR